MQLHRVPKGTYAEIVKKHAGVSLGVTPEEAQRIADVSTWAIQHGRPTHHYNVLLVNGRFCKDCGFYSPGAEIERRQTLPAIEYWWANGKPGPAVAFPALDQAMKMAAEVGVGIVAVGGTSHMGCPACYAWKGAEAGYLTTVECMSPRPEVTPFAGTQARMTTGPFARGIPAKRVLGHPIVVDFAPTLYTMGGVRGMIASGEKLPPGMGLDANGNPTTEPAEVFPNGSLLYGSHKLFALAVAMHATAVTLAGFQPPSARSKLVAENAPNDVSPLSFIISAIQPPKLALQEAVSPEEGLVTWVEFVARGNGNVRFPGVRGFNFANRSGRDVLLSDAALSDLAQWAGEAGVAFDPQNYATEGGVNIEEEARV